MTTLPQLETDRLRLRPLEPSDAPTVQVLAGAREIAATTTPIPHPYGHKDAEDWIRRSRQEMERGQGFTFAIVRKANNGFLGAVGLNVDPENRRAELGYWIGVPYWNQGYTTEAVRRILRFGFEVLKLNRVFATYFTNSPAAARVMQKAGMKYEGIMRQHLMKWGEFVDLGYYGLLCSEWEGSQHG